MNQLSKACVVAVLAGLLAPAAVAAAPLPAKPVARTKVSTQIFMNASDVQRSGISTADEGFAVELKRLYINVDHTFNENWTGHLTTDVQWVRDKDLSDLFFRHVYLQRRMGESHSLRLGNAPTPWIQRAAQLNGFRYVEADLVTRNKLGLTADWGVQVLGDAGQFNYSVAALTGAGYEKPRTGNRADLEALLSWMPTKQVQFAVGSYHGTRAMDAGSAARLHTAERWNALASYVDKDLRVGAEYFYADNWSRVTQVSPDASRGWSGWSSYQLTPAVAVFARHDRTDMSLRLDPTREERFSQLGVEWTQSKNLRLSLVGKRNEVASETVNATANEVGVWGQMMF